MNAGVRDYDRRGSHVGPDSRQVLTDAVDVVIVGGGRRPLAAARLRESGVKDIRIIEGGDSAVPGTGIDIEAPSATSKATSTCRCWKRSATSRRKEQLRQRDPRACARIGDFTSNSIAWPAAETDQRDARHRMSRWLITTESRRRHAHPLRGHLERSLNGRSCRHPASRPSRAIASPADGTTATGGSTEGGTTKLCRQTCGNHRHRGHGDRVRPHWVVMRRHLYVPADALVGRRARNKPTDRSG